MCHSAVPAINAYGRYIQCTGFGALDPKLVKRVLPVWLGEDAQYDSQDAVKSHQAEFGNLAIHAAGFATNSITFHVHQWNEQNDHTGGTDSLWTC